MKNLTVVFGELYETFSNNDANFKSPFGSSEVLFVGPAGTGYKPISRGWSVKYELVSIASDTHAFVG